MAEPCVAIVLCTYNGEQYLTDLLNSILAQTYQNWKLWVSDDGSTDKSIDIIHNYEDKYRDKIHLLPEHKKYGACINFLSALVNHRLDAADYYMFADQDDVWFPDKVQKMCAEMETMERKYEKQTPLLVYSDYRVTDENLNVIAPSFTQYERYVQKCDSFHHLLIHNTIAGAASIMNCSLRQKITEIPKEAVMHDHWIVLIAAQFGHIHYIPEATYDYRQHQSNVFGAKSGGLVSELRSKLKVRANKTTSNATDTNSCGYATLFRQGKEFLRIYGDQLSEEEKESLQQFLTIPSSNRLKKAYIILKNGFICDRVYRTVGEILFI